MAFWGFRDDILVNDGLLGYSGVCNLWDGEGRDSSNTAIVPIFMSRDFQNPSNIQRLRWGEF